MIKNVHSLCVSSSLPIYCGYPLSFDNRDATFVLNQNCLQSRTQGVLNCCNQSQLTLSFPLMCIFCEAEEMGDTKLVERAPHFLLLLIMMNRPYSYFRYWAGTSHLSLFDAIPTHEPPLQASCSKIPGIRIWLIKVICTTQSRI